MGRAAAARLRESAPAGLADRIRLAVELAAPPRRGRRGRTVLAAATLVAAVALAALVLLLPSPRVGEPPTIAAVLQSAQRLPAAGSTSVGGATSGPVLVGEPTTLAAGDAHLCPAWPADCRCADTCLPINRSPGAPRPQSIRHGLRLHPM